MWTLPGHLGADEVQPRHTPSRYRVRMEDTTIEVWISPSDYGCCGVPFAVGDDIGFTLVRFVDKCGDRYWDNRHPIDDAPGVDVHGRVEAIVAGYERMVPVAGAHQLTNDPNDTLERIVDAVPTAGDPDGYAETSYRVMFRVPIDAELPAPRRPFPEPEAYVLPRPERIILLTHLIDEVEERFGDAVVILRARDDAAVTLAPTRADAAAVRWNSTPTNWSSRSSGPNGGCHGRATGCPSCGSSSTRRRVEVSRRRSRTMSSFRSRTRRTGSR